MSSIGPPTSVHIHLFECCRYVKKTFFRLSHILFIVSSFSSEDNERIFIIFFTRLYLRKEDEEKNIQRNRIILNVKARFGKVRPSFQPIQELVGQKVCAVLSTTKKKKKKTMSSKMYNDNHNNQKGNNIGVINAIGIKNGSVRSDTRI